MVRLQAISYAFVLVTVLFNLCACQEGILPRRHQQYDLAPDPRNCHSRDENRQPPNIIVEHPKPIDDKGENSQLPFSKYTFKKIPANTNTVVHKSSDIIFQNGPTHIVINHPDLIIQPAPVLFHTPAALVSDRKSSFRNVVQPPPVAAIPERKHTEHQHLAYPKENVLPDSRLFNNFESSIKPTYNFPPNTDAQINRVNSCDNDGRYYSSIDEEQRQPNLRHRNIQEPYALLNKFDQPRHQQEEAIEYNENLKQQREQSQRHFHYQPEVKQQYQSQEPRQQELQYHSQEPRQQELQQPGHYQDEEEFENEEEESEIIEINEEDLISQIPEQPVQQQNSFAEERHFNPRHRHRSVQ